MAQAPRDENRIATLLGTSNVDGTTPVTIYADPTTHRLLIDNAGSGLSIIAVSGTIDDSNVSFTSASEPTVLIINGGIYQKTGGAITWSYLAGTITLSTPVGTGGSIFGLS